MITFTTSQHHFEPVQATQCSFASAGTRLASAGSLHCHRTGMPAHSHFCNEKGFSIPGSLRKIKTNLKSVQLNKVSK